MQKFIHVTKETREFIAKAFNISGRMVNYALRFEKNTDLAKRIQILAMQKGGIIMNEVPEIETIHDADGYMRQYLPNGAMIEFNKATGEVDVLFRGEKVYNYHMVLVSDIANIQNIAASLK